MFQRTSWIRGVRDPASLEDKDQWQKRKVKSLPLHI